MEEWWLFGLIIGFFVLHLMWKAYTDQSHVLGRQAANMNWIAVGRVEDADGYKNVKLARNGMEAVISFQNKNVELVYPPHSAPFKDFIELERWITKLEEDDINEEELDDEELNYYEEINRITASYGFYEPLLELQGTDPEFCIASMDLHKTGYETGKSPRSVAALTVEAVHEYKKNRELSIIFLQTLAENFYEEDGDDLDDG